MRFMILGGTGYLGSKLICSLLQDGHEVLCLKRRASDLKRLPEKQKGLQFCEIESIADYLVFQPQEWDWFINAACTYSKKGIKDELVLEGNLLTPLRAYLLAMEAGVKRFMTIGTGLCDDFNIYSKSKAEFADFGAFYCKRKAQAEQIFLNIRLENFYGRDEPEDRFLHRIIVQMQAGDDVLLTEGLQHRDFICIEDVVDNLQMLLNTQFLPGYYNIPLGTGEGPTVREVVEYLHKELKSTSQLCFGAIPLREYEPDSVADKAAMQSFGIKTKHSWKSGLKEQLLD